MKYTGDQLIWDVLNEAIALRKNATFEERQRLNFDTLKAMSHHDCIYGQMTGDCFNKRAIELISISCTRYFRPGAVSFGNTIERITSFVNGITVNNLSKRRAGIFESRYSAIEAYITLPDAKIQNLITYLRGETQKLDLTL